MSTYRELREAQRACLALGLCLVRGRAILAWALNIATAVAVVLPFWWVAKTVLGLLGVL